MRYFTFIETESVRHACPYFDNLEDAMELYNKHQMKSFRDNVFLGIASDEIGMNSGYCFDILHKFYHDHILINDYMFYEDYPETKEAVEKVLGQFFVRYQFTPNILDGALIDYASPFARSLTDKQIEEKWNEIHLEVLKNNKLETVGWRKPIRRTFDAYSWNWPKRTSYVGLMNVTAIDKSGHKHEIDVDPRDYLLALGKKVSIPKETM